MADDLARLLAENYGPSTADVLNRMPQPNWHDRYVPAWLKGIGSAALAKQEPNWFGREVLSRIPPEAMMAANFLIPGMKTRIQFMKLPKRGLHDEVFYDAMLDHKLAGRLKVHPDNTVGNIFVDTPFRRQGLASALYDYAARDLGVPRLGSGSYHTPEGMALRAAYERRRIDNPIKAYHGSPHDFDKFDLSKIGSGEGAQAYGHGLYFAEQPEVAKSYKFAGQPTYFGRNAHSFATDALERAKAAGLTGEPARKHALEYLDSMAVDQRLKGMNPRAISDAANNFDALVGGKGGKIYEVALHATPEQFLDWDKPLSGQGEAVRTALEPVASRLERDLPWRRAEPPGVEDIIRGRKGAEASTALNEAGIPGIRYLDQGSRGAPQRWLARHPRGGIDDFPDEASARAFIARNPEYTLAPPRPQTSNYVVWNDSIIELLRKYGIAAPVMAPTLADVLTASSGSDRAP